MKILFITPMSPLETGHGGAVRTRFLWDALRQQGDVYTSVCDGKDEPISEGNKIRHCKVFNGIKTKIPATKIALLSFVFPWLDWAFHDKEYILGKLGWPGEHFDKAVVRLPQFMSIYWQMFFCVAYWKIAPLYVDIDDLPSQDFKTTRMRWYSLARGRLYYLLNIIWQSFLYRNSRGAWVANQFQQNWVRPFCRCSYLPNVVRVPSRVESLGVPDDGCCRLLVVGFMGHPPNVHGLNWFLEQIWLPARKEHASLELVIVGSKMSDDLKAKWSAVPDVIVKGFVENIDDAYADCTAVVVPILTGGGTCVKLIEALAHGKKVFATSFGARGLSADQLRRAHVSLFNSADEFNSCLSSYVSRPDVEKHKIAFDAKEMIISDYSESYFIGQVKGLINA